MMDKLCSVIICTHNPRQDFLCRVLDGIQKQTLSKDSFEFVLVDNLSDPGGALSDIDLSWHPAHKMVVEKTLGLTAARLRGFRETSADLIIFCDDDNVLEQDYLERAIEIADAYPLLGAWGGTCEGEFETSTLPEWVNDGFFSSVGVRSVTEIQWSNLLNHCCPVGAGMVLRRNVADAYLKKMEMDSSRMLLGRNGASLMSSEDIDLANTASEIGMGTGLFPSLTLKHLIPSQRLTLEYYERLTEGIAASNTILRHIQGGKKKIDHNNGNYIKDTLKDIYCRFKNSKEDYIIHKARIRGNRMGLDMIEKMQSMGEHR